MIEGLKPYPEYKTSLVPWVQRVPRDWKVVPVRRMGLVQGGKALAATAPGEQHPYLRVANVFDGHIDARQVHTMPFTASEFSRFRLRPDDVLLNEGQSLELVGRAARYAGTPPDCAYQNSLIRVRAFATAEPRFLEALFRHAQASGIFATIATQTTSIAHLGVDRLADLSLPFPPLADQQAIVRFLDHAERRIRRYIAARRKMIALLEEQKHTIIDRAVMRGLEPNVRLKDSGVPWLGRVPEHWILQAVRKLGRVQGGKALAARAPGAQRPYLRVANVFDGRIDARQVHTMPFTDSEFSRFQLHENDILLNEGQSLELVGRTALYEGVSGEFAFQNSLIRVQAHPHALPHFLEALFRFAQHSGIFAMIATQTTSIAHLGVNRLADLVFALPPLAEQERIVQHISSEARELDRLRRAEERGIELLREYRRRLISDVVTGKLDVREAALCLPDEPAEEIIDEVLLDDEVGAETNTETLNTEETAA